LAKTNPALHLELSQPREGPTVDPKRKSKKKSNATRGVAAKQSVSRRGPGFETDAESESMSDGGDTSDYESDGKSEYDPDENSPFGDKENVGDDEDVSPDDIIKCMMTGSTQGLDIDKRDDGSFFRSMSGIAEGFSPGELENFGRGKRKHKPLDKEFQHRYWND
jgi:hypothetical protein